MKTDAFEEDLRQALAHRAAEVPQTAVDRLRRRNYRPRTHSRVTLAGAGLVAAAAAAAAATAVIVPAASPPTRAQLAAWTVTRQADGIHVTIRELSDPAGLQRKLRSEGLPASVTFFDHPSPACRPYTGPGGQRVFASVTPRPPAVSYTLIRPAALPPHTGVQLAGTIRPAKPAGHLRHVDEVMITTFLVHASQQCTGG